jgi:hypothetical protein
LRPGRRAELVVLRDLTSFTPELVTCRGRPVEPAPDRPAVDTPFGVPVRVPGDLAGLRHLTGADHAFRLASTPSTPTPAPADVVLPARDGWSAGRAAAPVVTVLERHTGRGGPQVAPVLGFDWAPELSPPPTPTTATTSR